MSEPAAHVGLLATVLEIAQVRLELLGTEVELEKQRPIDGLFCAARLA